MGRRVALLIATYEHHDAGLRRLTAPAADAEALAAVLRDPDIAGFEVTVLVNEPHHRVGEAIGDFYRDRRRGDLTLLYFTGHGLKDDDGKLYLAMSNTRRDSLLFTSLPAEQIDYAIEGCICRQKILVLDCCYSGAFPAGRAVKADSQVHALARFQGRGRTVLTASDSTQYSFEGDQIHGTATQSVFTRHLVEGLRSGGADLDGDGDITLDELYTYVHDRVVEEMPRQRPKKQTDIEGRTVIARNVNWALPGHLRNAVNSPIATDRLGALEGLLHLHRIGNDRVRASVATEIERLTHDDSRTVSIAAAAHLHAIHPADPQPAAPHPPLPTDASASRPAAEPTPSATDSIGTGAENQPPPGRADSSTGTDTTGARALPPTQYRPGRASPARTPRPGPAPGTSPAAHEQPDPTNAATAPEISPVQPPRDLGGPGRDRSLPTPPRPQPTAAVVRRWLSGWRGKAVAAFAVLSAVALLITAITTFKPSTPSTTSSPLATSSPSTTSSPTTTSGPIEERLAQPAQETSGTATFSITSVKVGDGQVVLTVTADNSGSDKPQSFGACCALLEEPTYKLRKRPAFDSGDFPDGYMIPAGRRITGEVIFTDGGLDTATTTLVVTLAVQTGFEWPEVQLEVQLTG